MTPPDPPSEDTPELQSARDEERYRSLKAVQPAAPESLELLLEGLYDGSWRVRRAAADLLPQLPRPGQVAERLVQVLGDRDNPGARNAAADALAKLGEPALPFVLGILQSPE